MTKISRCVVVLLLLFTAVACAQSMRGITARSGSLGNGVVNPQFAPSLILNPGTTVTVPAATIGSGDTSTELDITVAGTADWVVTNFTLGGTNASDFSISESANCSSLPQTVTLGSTCVVTITMHATTAGTKNATLSIVGNQPGSPSVISIVGTVLGQPVMDLNGLTQINCGDQTEGTTKNCGAVTITNTGTATLNVTGISFTGSSDFAHTPCCNAIAPGGSDGFSVSFMPSTTGAIIATLEIDSDASNSPLTIALTGNGVASPSASLNLEPSISGRYFRLKELTEVNGNAWASAAEVYLYGVDGNKLAPSGWTATCDSEETVAASNACTNAIDGNTTTFWHTQFAGSSPPPPHQITIDTGSSHTISALGYLPRQDGCSNGWIKDYELYASSDNVTYALVKSGTFDYSGEIATCDSGTIPAERVTQVGSSPLDFGSVVVGSSSQSQVVSIYNTGDATAIITVAPATSGDYNQTNDCGATLAANASCAATITFSPTATGTRTGSLTISTSTAQYSASLTGIGKAPATLTALTLSGQSTVNIGFDTSAYTASGTLSDGSNVDETSACSGHWASSATNIATINATSGVAHGVAEGTTNIRCTIGSVTGSTSLSVQNALSGAIVNTDFEDGPSTPTTCNSNFTCPSGIIPPFTDVNCPGCHPTHVGIGDYGIAHSGSKAIQIHYNVSCNGSCSGADDNSSFDYSWSSSQNVREVWVQFWQYRDLPLTGGQDNSDVQRKMIYFFGAGFPASGWGIHIPADAGLYCRVEEVIGTTLALDDYFHDSDGTNAGECLPHTTWTLFKFHLKLNDSGQSNGVIEVWRNGVKETLSGHFDPNALNLPNDPITSVQIGRQCDVLTGFKCNENRYFDDVVISTTDPSP